MTNIQNSGYLGHRYSTIFHHDAFKYYYALEPTPPSKSVTKLMYLRNFLPNIFYITQRSIHSIMNFDMSYLFTAQRDSVENAGPIDYGVHLKRGDHPRTARTKSCLLTTLS